MSISLNPPKWTADRKPEEFRVRKYIFDTRRTVCESFWYDEYLWPLVEDAAIWEAKSGEDVWGTELTKITNRNWEISDLALRPEMTPTVTRMIAKYQREYTKPIRRFSIANFYRNERPQRWRNREFWQCNVDLFGSELLTADIEVLQMACETMKAFWATSEQYKIYINDRRVVDHFLNSLSLDDDLRKEAVRTMDKWDKMSEQDFISTLEDKWVSVDQSKSIAQFMKHDKLLWEVSQDINLVYETLQNLWYWDFVAIKPSLMRWFDYYDGMVFEVFDLHPDNNRAMFWWWRYNGLADIFGVKDSIPAVWFAPWDEPMKLFLESWDLIPTELQQERYFVPLLEEWKEEQVLKKAQEMRSEWKRVECWIKVQNEAKAFEYAFKKWIERDNVILI